MLTRRGFLKSFATFVGAALLWAIFPSSALAPPVKATFALSYEDQFGLASVSTNIGGGGQNTFTVYSRTSFPTQTIGDHVGARVVRSDDSAFDLLINTISGTVRNNLHSARQAIRNGTGSAAQRESNAQSAATAFAAEVNTAMWNAVKVQNPDWDYWNSITPQQRITDFPPDGAAPPQFVWPGWAPLFEWGVGATWAARIYPLRFGITVYTDLPIPQ